MKVDIRENFTEVPSQTVITRDNAPVDIDFLIYWKIVEPMDSLVNVGDFQGALQGIATTTLRAVVGDMMLDDVLSKRDQVNDVLRVKLSEQTERWGGKVTTVEIRELIPPPDVQDSMNRVLTAERTAAPSSPSPRASGRPRSTWPRARSSRPSSSAEGVRQSVDPRGRGLQPRRSRRIFEAAKHHRRSHGHAAVLRGPEAAG